MAIGRYYKVGVFDTSTQLATGATVTTTTPTPILVGVLSASSDINISAIRVGCFGSGSGFPSNASFVASLNTCTTAPSGGNAATVVQLSGIAKASLVTSWTTAGGTGAAAITGMTQTKFWWSQTLPFTAGANWAEWFTPGFEINVPVSTQVAIYITASSAGTGTSFSGEIEYSE